MKNSFESWLRIVLLLGILYSTSFAAFAQSSTSRSRKAKPKADAPATVIDPNLTPAAGATVATNDSLNQKPELVPRLKRRKRVAIVPAPPPGQIPIYVPERR